MRFMEHKLFIDVKSYIEIVVMLSTIQPLNGSWLFRRHKAPPKLQISTEYLKTTTFDIESKV